MPDGGRDPEHWDPLAPSVKEFRAELRDALRATDDEGRTWAAAQWGCYAFYDYDGEPIYVGQTNEQLRVRVQRHLTNQRTDAVAMRILDVFEVAELELWPLWEYQGLTRRRDPAAFADAKAHLDALEFTAYLRAIEASRFDAILNEKIPLETAPIPLPPSRRFALVSPEVRQERGHPDIRIARRADTISRLAAVAHERGAVSYGLRRVLVIQALRLAHLSASRLAALEGREPPSPSAIDTAALVGNVRTEPPMTLPLDDLGDSEDDTTDE